MHNFRFTRQIYHPIKTFAIENISIILIYKIAAHNEPKLAGLNLQRRIANVSKEYTIHTKGETRKRTQSLFVLFKLPIPKHPYLYIFILYYLLIERKHRMWRERWKNGKTCMFDEHKTHVTGEQLDLAKLCISDRSYRQDWSPDML